jgi:predicted short-subunit dehydrogenase-like oxidoreductase (DUF2520 family)
MISKISIIGTGNVANWYFQTLLRQNNNLITVQQVSSRDLSKLFEDSDLYIFSLKDAVYPEVIANIPFQMKLAIHTAGALPITIFQGKADHFGVLYPFQTIHCKDDSSFNPELEVPICVEGDQEQTTQILMEFAATFSQKVYPINFEDRHTIHLAAVFASNFSTIMYDIAYQILQKKQIDWQIMLPLLEETVHKTNEKKPIDTLTGPAKRKDFKIIEEHLAELKDTPYDSIYRLITDYIIRETI